MMTPLTCLPGIPTRRFQHRGRFRLPNEIHRSDGCMRHFVTLSGIIHIDSKVLMSEPCLFECLSTLRWGAFSALPERRRL
jgi:hypothetical protein